jgi:PadR family transcriptional regulator
MSPLRVTLEPAAQAELERRYQATRHAETRTRYQLHHAAERPIDGAWMSAELARHGYRISPGTLYPTLHRLEAAGLLTGHDDLEASRRVRRYTITDADREALAEARRALRELSDELLT